MPIDDQQLEQVAQQLGSRAAERLDVDKTASDLIARLREQRESVVWWRRRPAIGAVAAAAVILIAFGILFDDGSERGNSDLAMNGTPVVLQELSVDELEEVFDSLSFEAPVHELTNASLEDLSVGELEELLESMVMED